MRPSPLLTALGAGAGTLVVLGGSTFLLSGMVLQVTKHVVRHRKMAAAQPCSQCSGSGFVGCQICMGKALIRCRAPVSMKQLLQQRRRGAAGGSSAAGVQAPPPVLAACPACGTTCKQRCLNCLGDGRLCLPA